MILFLYKNRIIEKKNTKRISEKKNGGEGKQRQKNHPLENFTLSQFCCYYCKRVQSIFFVCLKNKEILKLKSIFF